MLASAAGIHRIGDVEQAVAALRQVDNISSVTVEHMDLGTGSVTASLDVPRELFYEVISRRSGFDIGDDGDLVSLLTELADVKR